MKTSLTSHPLLSGTNCTLGKILIQGVFRALKTLKALKTLNSENLTLKTPKTLKRPVFLCGKTLKMTIIQDILY